MSRNRGVVKLTAQSPAKINLFLYVLGRRDDGYHDISTLFVPISIYDTITITSSRTTVLKCNVPYIPVNSKNIILKTDAILREDYGLDAHFNIELVKRIPVGAGLGGGSSNAAVYLQLANQGAKLGLSHKDMADIMGRVGSDTVFFLKNVPSLGSGRGEVLEDFFWLPKFYLLVINPQIPISTKDVYSHPDLVYADRSDIPMVDKPLSFKEMVGLMKNSLEVPVFKMYAIVKDLVESINVMGRGFGLMSGSGSSVFGVYEHIEDRDKDFELFQAEYPSYFIKKAETI